MTSGLTTTCSSPATTSPKRSVGRSRAGAPTSTGGSGRLRDQSYGARRSRAGAEDPPGRHCTGSSQPGAGYCVGERAPDNDARGQANDDRQVDDRADAHLRVAPRVPRSRTAPVPTAARRFPRSPVLTHRRAPRPQRRGCRDSTARAAPAEVRSGPRRMQGQAPGSEDALGDPAHEDQVGGKPRTVAEGRRAVHGGHGAARNDQNAGAGEEHDCRSVQDEPTPADGGRRLGRMRRRWGSVIMATSRRRNDSFRSLHTAHGKSLVAANVRVSERNAHGHEPYGADAAGDGPPGAGLPIRPRGQGAHRLPGPLRANRRGPDDRARRGPGRRCGPWPRGPDRRSGPRGTRLPGVGPVRLMTVRVSGTHVGSDVSRDNTFPMGGVQRSEDSSSDDWSP